MLFRSLEQLTMKNGKFFDSRKKQVRVRVLGLNVATARNMAGGPLGEDPRPIFKDETIPKGANAFAQGPVFDENAGGWMNFPRYAAATIFLQKSR